MSERVIRSMALMDAKADVKMLKNRTNINWYDTKILANAVYLILEELTDTPQTEQKHFDKPSKCLGCVYSELAIDFHPCASCENFSKYVGEISGEQTEQKGEE